MLSILGLGFLIGLRHALEADHAAAVATLATRSQSVAHTVKQGLTWGLGHTLTLLLFGSLVFLLEVAVPERLAHWLEFGVGVMLLGLGMDVIWKLIKGRVYFHLHEHPHQVRHFHAYSHKGASREHSSQHEHTHLTPFPYRALLVGFMHGMAGSAALILLTLQQSISPLMGLLYIIIFGLGSMAGMAMLSVVIAIPLRYSARFVTWVHHGLQGCIGMATIALGLLVLHHTGLSLLN